MHLATFLSPWLTFGFATRLLAAPTSSLCPILYSCQLWDRLLAPRYTDTLLTLAMLDEWTHCVPSLGVRLIGCRGSSNHPHPLRGHHNAFPT